MALFCLGVCVCIVCALWQSRCRILKLCARLTNMCNAQKRAGQPTSQPVRLCGMVAPPVFSLPALFVLGFVAITHSDVWLQWPKQQHQPLFCCCFCSALAFIHSASKVNPADSLTCTFSRLTSGAHYHRIINIVYLLFHFIIIHFDCCVIFVSRREEKKKQK